MKELELTSVPSRILRENLLSCLKKKSSVVVINSRFSLLSVRVGVKKCKETLQVLEEKEPANAQTPCYVNNLCCYCTWSKERHRVYCWSFFSPFIHKCRLCALSLSISVFFGRQTLECRFGMKWQVTMQGLFFFFFSIKKREIFLKWSVMF